MRNRIILVFFIMTFCLTAITSFVFIHATEVLAQSTGPYACIVRNDPNVPFPYQFIKTRFRSYSAFEIDVAITTSQGNKIRINMVNGTGTTITDTANSTIVYYIGDDLYNSSSPQFITLDIADINSVLLLSTLSDTFEDPNASIDSIYLMGNNIQFDYISFYDSMVDGNLYEPSNETFTYSSFADSGWTNLTLTTGSPSIVDGTYLLLTAIQSSSYPYPYPYPYSGYYGSYPYGGYTYGNFYGSYPYGGYSYGYPYGGYPYSGYPYSSGLYGGFPYGGYPYSGYPYSSFSSFRGFYGSYPGFMGSSFGRFPYSGYPYFSPYGGFYGSFSSTFPYGFLSGYPGS